MGSSRVEEERVESTGINPQGVDEIQEAGKQEAGTSLAGETEPPFLDPGDRAASNSTDVHQHGAGELPETREAKARQDIDAVFGAIEKDLEKHDERERRLANAYRDSQRERKEREHKARLGRGGYTTYNPVESADDSCYIEIKNLVFIENSVIHKKALEEWDRKRELFAQRVERKSTAVGSLKNEVFQLIFFSVFQGVVITATSQTNLLPCSSRWSTILLSVLASIVIIAGVIQKLMRISSLEETIYSEEQALKDVVLKGQDLRRMGKDFVFAKSSEGKKRGLKNSSCTWYAVGVVSFLVVFAVIFPLSQWKILCSGRPLPLH